jgi:hypothetical protein
MTGKFKTDLLVGPREGLREGSYSAGRYPPAGAGKAAGGLVPLFRGDYPARTRTPLQADVTAPNLPAATEHANRALNEAKQWDWHLLLGSLPVLLAPVARLSPALIDRLLQFCPTLAHLLHEILP